MAGIIIFETFMPAQIKASVSMWFKPLKFIHSHQIEITKPILKIFVSYICIHTEKTADQTEYGMY